MVESAYVPSMDTTINELEFIDLEKKGRISINEPCLCTNEKCRVPLEPIGIERIKTGVLPKKLGFRITNNSGRHHIPGCTGLTYQESLADTNVEAKEIQYKITNGDLITLSPTTSNKESVNSQGSSNATKKQVTIYNHNSHSSNQEKINNHIFKNCGSFVELFRNPQFNNKNQVKLEIGDSIIKNNHSKISFEDLFVDLDTVQSVQMMEFHIFYGTIKTSFFGDKGSPDTGIKFTFLNNGDLKVYANIGLLKNNSIGKHILNSKGQNSILYFEGYFEKIGNNIKSHKISDSFAHDIYMRKDFN